MDLVIRATVVFFFIFLVTRVVGRRELSDLEPFDFILLVVLAISSSKASRRATSR
jgi:uncharacterized membrane protein YcaP (DUF421 family)